MADRQERLGIVVYVEDQATGKLTRVKAEIAGLGPAGATAGAGLARASGQIEKSATRIGGALSHAKGAIGGLLSGPLGFLGLTAGVLSVGGAFETGIGKAERWGLAIEKIGPLTGMTTEQMSGLLAVTERLGIENDAVVTTFGRLDKNLEKLGGTSKAAAKFQKEYGFSVRDSAGHVKDAETLLLTFSDYYKNNTNETKRNAAAAAIWGKSYTQLIPLFELGAQGYKDLTAEAAKYGLVLTQDNVKALEQSRKATRDWGDALGGLELQLGLGLLPKLTELATWGSSFVAAHGHEIVKFFTDLADFAGSAAGTIGSVVGAIATAWNLLPPELRSIITTGFVADRTIKFLFGFSPVGALLSGIERPIASAISSALAGTALGKLAGGIFQRGSTPVNPLFVSDVAKGAAGLLGAGEGAAAAAGEAGIGMTVGAAATALAAGAGLGLIMAAAAEWIIATGSDPYNVKGRTGTATARGLPTGGMDPTFSGPRSSAPYGSYVPPGSSTSFHDSAELRAAEVTKQALIDFRASERADWSASVTATRALTGVMRDAPWLSKLEASWRKAGQTMHDKIKAAIAGLSGPHAGAAAAFLGSKLGNAGFGAGGYDQAQHVLTLLRAMKQSPEVVAAIHRLEGRLTRLKLDRDDLAAAEKIAQSSDPKNKKLDELNKLMADLKAHGDKTAQKKLGDIITAVKHQKLHTTVNLGTKTIVDAFVRSTGVSTKIGATSLVSRYSNTRYEYAKGGAYAAGARLVGEEGPELDVATGPGFIFNAAQTRALATAMGRSGGGLTNALGHVSNPTARAAIERNLERLIAALEASAARPHVARVSHRDFEAAQIRRQAVGPSRARQFALSGG